jgi:hypothetical protein
MTLYETKARPLKRNRATINATTEKDSPPHDRKRGKPGRSTAGDRQRVS